MERQGNRFILQLDADDAPWVVFKCTTGSWERGEVQANGSDMENRRYQNIPGDTIYCHIAAWKNQFVIETKPLNQQIIITERYAPFLAASKILRIYLPPDYTGSDQSYPVVYMLDGQNLFDAATAYNGEWEVDETMDRLHAAGMPTAIVVGIDHAGELRLDEYAPWKHATYGGGLGDAFAQWVTDSVKGYIDDHYRTLPDRAHTFIIGSSIAAVTSLYMLLEKNEVFGGAGMVSPAFWFNPELLDYVSAHAPKQPSRAYFICGGSEDISEEDNTVFDMMVVYDLINEYKGDEHDLRFVIEAQGRHNETILEN
jgi:predicted alpha/beta superfamily hydrolase